LLSSSPLIANRLKPTVKKYENGLYFRYKARCDKSRHFIAIYLTGTPIIIAANLSYIVVQTEGVYDKGTLKYSVT
jgi:hypothetical protein